MIEQEVSAGTAQDASEDLKVVDLVEPREVGDGVSEAGAEGAVNRGGAVVAGGKSLQWGDEALADISIGISSMFD